MPYAVFIKAIKYKKSISLLSREAYSVFTVLVAIALSLICGVTVDARVVGLITSLKVALAIID